MIFEKEGGEGLRLSFFLLLYLFFRPSERARNLEAPKVILHAFCAFSVVKAFSLSLFLLGLERKKKKKAKEENGDPGLSLAADGADAPSSKIFCDEDALSSTHWGQEKGNRAERELASRRKRASRGWDGSQVAQRGNFGESTRILGLRSLASLLVPRPCKLAHAPLGVFGPR